MRLVLIILQLSFFLHLFWKFTFGDPQCAHIHSIDVCRPWITKQYKLFFHWHLFFYFISNNSCRLLTINIVSFIFFLIWGRCNLKSSRRTVIFLPVYKISSLIITPPKTQNSGQFSYPLLNIVSFLFEKKSTRVPV
jgi:hypothetical protein